MKNLKNSILETKKEVVLFVNEEAAQFEMTALTNTVAEVKTVRQFLVDSDVLLNALTIKQACNKKFDAIVENFMLVEKEKLSIFEKQFGVLSLLTGNSDARLQDEAEKIRSKLLANVPKMHYQAHYYLDFIDFETLEVRPEINEAYFFDKHSIKVDAETEKHQSNLVNALNYFYELFPDLTTQIIFENIVAVDWQKKRCAKNLTLFDRQKSIRDFVSKRVNEPNYSR